MEDKTPFVASLLEYRYWDFKVISSSEGLLPSEIYPHKAIGHCNVSGYLRLLAELLAVWSSPFLAGIILARYATLPIVECFFQVHKSNIHWFSHSHLSIFNRNESIG